MVRASDKVHQQSKAGPAARVSCLSLNLFGNSYEIGVRSAVPEQNRREEIIIDDVSASHKKKREKKRETTYLIMLYLSYSVIFMRSLRLIG